MNGTGVVSLLTFFGSDFYGETDYAATHNSISETCPVALRICALMDFGEEAGEPKGAQGHHLGARCGRVDSAIDT